ncbi:hypothetical protein Vi05172_g6967 [Venturia inaequalis]|nr:hypothetical protein Vi05172_g6967 [Venturia inaequalis]
MVRKHQVKKNLPSFLSALLSGMSFPRPTFLIAGNSGPPLNDKLAEGAQPSWTNGAPPVGLPTPPPLPPLASCFIMYSQINYGGHYKHICTTDCINLSTHTRDVAGAFANYSTDGTIKPQSIQFVLPGKWGRKIYGGIDCGLQDLGRDVEVNIIENQDTPTSVVVTRCQMVIASPCVEH